jgi:hypothetical protein
LWSTSVFCRYFEMWHLVRPCRVSSLEKYFVNGIHDGFSSFVDSCYSPTTLLPADCRF